MRPADEDTLDAVVDAVEKASRLAKPGQSILVPFLGDVNYPPFWLRMLESMMVGRGYEVAYGEHVEPSESGGYPQLVIVVTERSAAWMRGRQLLVPGSWRGSAAPVEAEAR